MRSNPFRLTLAILGIGLLGLGAILWVIGTALADPANPNGTADGAWVGAAGLALLRAGWLPFLAWLLVGALQWVKRPAESREGLSEAEVAARLTRAPGAD